MTVEEEPTDEYRGPMMLGLVMLGALMTLWGILIGWIIWG